MNITAATIYSKTDLSLNDTNREWLSCGAIVYCFESFVSRGITSHGYRRQSV